MQISEKSIQEPGASYPVRIKRNKKCENIYPIGDGAGYTSGIMSSAVDAKRIIL